MNNNITQNLQTDIKENILAGIVGAFLFSLVGGALWFILYLVGFIAGISGLVGVVCAVKGYSFFSKKESAKGIVISVIITLLVMVLAWYLCLAYDVFDAYKSWYENGEVEYALTYFESVRVAHYFLAEPEVGPAYIGDLVIGLLFCIVGGGSYVVNKMRNAKANAYPAAATAPTASATVSEAAEATAPTASATVSETAETAAQPNDTGDAQ